MRFELIKRVPIVEIGGKRCFLDTSFPHASMPAYVPPEGVIGYDFFANFTIAADRVGGKMTFVNN